MTRIIISNFRTAISNSVRDKMDTKVNLDGRKEEVIDIELKEGKKIALSELDAGRRLLSYKDRQVALYIRDHGEDAQAALEDGSQGRRFHVTFCRTLKEMKRDGLELYVATTDFSGDFHITGVHPETGTPLAGKAELELCQNCLEQLGLKRNILYEFLSSRRSYSRNRKNFEYSGLNPSLQKLLRRWV